MQAIVGVEPAWLRSKGASCLSVGTGASGSISCTCWCAEAASACSCDRSCALSSGVSAFGLPTTGGCCCCCCWGAEIALLHGCSGGTSSMQSESALSETLGAAVPTLAHACAALATLSACLLVPSPMASPSPASRFLFLFSNAGSQVLCSAGSFDASCSEICTLCWSIKP